MDANKLLAFLYVAEQQSFSKGAEHLFLNQPTISARIRALESELEVELFERSKGKGVSLTTYGKLFLPQARKILEVMKESKEILHREKYLNNSHVRIGASVTGNYLLPTFFGKFYQSIPNLEITIVSGFAADLVDMVSKGTLDIGIIVDSVDFNGLEHVPLTQEKLVLTFSPDFIKDYTDPQPFEHMLNQPFIVYGHKKSHEIAGSIAPIIQNYFDEHQFQLKNMVFVDQMDPLKGLLRQNNGFSILPQTIIAPEVARGEFTAIDFTPPIRDMWIHMVYRKGKSRQVIKSVQKIILEHFK